MKKIVTGVLVLTLILLTLGCKDHGGKKDEAAGETTLSSTVADSAENVPETVVESTVKESGQTGETASGADTDAVTEKEPYGSMPDQRQTEPPITQPTEETAAPPETSAAGSDAADSGPESSSVTESTTEPPEENPAESGTEDSGGVELPMDTFD